MQTPVDKVYCGRRGGLASRAEHRTDTYPYYYTRMQVMPTKSRQRRGSRPGDLGTKGLTAQTALKYSTHSRLIPSGSTCSNLACSLDWTEEIHSPITPAWRISETLSRGRPTRPHSRSSTMAPTSPFSYGASRRQFRLSVLVPAQQDQRQTGDRTASPRFPPEDNRTCGRQGES